MFLPRYLCSSCQPLVVALEHENVFEIREALRTMAAPESDVRIYECGFDYFAGLAFLYDVPELTAVIDDQRKGQPIYHSMFSRLQEHLRLIINTAPDDQVIRLLNKLYQKFAVPVEVRRCKLLALERPRSKELLDCLMATTDFGTYTNKFKLMEGLLFANNAEALAYGVEHHWLRRNEDKMALLELMKEKQDVSAECRSLLLSAYGLKEADASSLEFDENQTANELKKSWSLKKAEDGTYIITGYKGVDTDVVVPEKIGKTLVTQIAPGAFAPTGPRVSAGAARRRSAVTSLTIPGTIKKVPATLFHYPASRQASQSLLHIHSVALCEGVEEVGDEAFVRCSTLEHVTLPSTLRKIGDRSFAECTALRDVELPQEVKTIDDEAFSGSALLEIDVPESVESMGSGVFYLCSGLRRAIIRSNEAVSEGVFAGCSALTDVRLPDGLHSIGPEAFEDCTSLKDIRLPDSVQSIGIEAFDGCSALKRIHLPANLRSLGADAFSCCDDLEIY